MRRILIGFVLGAALTLSACGFEPLHAQRVAGDSGLSGVMISAGDEKIDFLIAQSVRDRIGENEARYQLVTESDLRRRRLGIRADDVASRYDMTLEVDYELLDIVTGEVLTEGTVNAVSTFGAPDDPYGRNAASSDAEERLADDIADRLVMELSRYFKKSN